ncbi:hypothetical protein LU631_11275 [Erwinia tracheiphila]|nr:hypothetical protein [Erwinia tracheiphila]EOS92589.1 hypothetical protein ETR_23694 [Erwinia tracheiphila PSU-1]KKF34370.1 hypothetical protein SY86_23605 [Erwinia tracheiphila]KKF34458.1 hypothetical protein SY86_01670 [Erwinia tracheiphila]KKF35857.1 hypothetical protein SY86_11125 [Erwinia tracheiphila]UIA85858.1 hypothetical protein LU604_01550 [Erwinia tracheiphila]
MATRNSSTCNKPSARDVVRTHQTTEINRKLHRARAMAFFLSAEILRRDYDPMPLYLQSALSYIADDVSDIQAIFKDFTSA